MPILHPYSSSGAAATSPEAEDVLFTYSVKGARACATYRRDTGSWTVKAGSTAVLEVKPYAQGIGKRRSSLMEAGKLEQREDGHLVYLTDVTYDSPSAAAGDVSGGSKNGWAVWLDEVGRPAQHHRPQTSSELD